MARSPQAINPDVGPAAPQQGAFTPQRIEGINPNAFGAGQARAEGEVSRAITQAGESVVRASGTMSDILIQEQALQNETNARNSATEAMRAMNEDWATYSQLQGNDAVSGFSTFQQSLRDRQQAALDATTNPAERRLLERSLQQHTMQMERGGIQWRAQQQRVASVNASNAAAALQVNNAVQARDRPEDMTAAVRAGELDLQNRGEVEGWDAATLSARQAEYRGGAYGAVIASIAETDPLRAASLFRSVRDSLDATSQVQIAQRLEGPVRVRVASDIVAQVTQAAAPRGVRNNNPLNIEAGSFTQGQPGYQGSDGRFARFATQEQGIAAADALLQGYASRGLDTPAKIIGRWAPSSDGNNVGAYAGSVARALGIGPNDAIDMTDPAQRRRLIDAMAQVENGQPIGAPTASAPARADAMREVMRRTADDPQLQAVAMSRLATFYSQEDQMHAQERVALTQTAQTTGAALEIGAVVPIPEAEIRRAFPPEQANRMLDTLYTQQVSGQMYTAIRYAPPSEIAAIQEDITNGSGPFSQALRQRRGIRVDADGQVAPEQRGEDVAIREALRGQFAERVRVRNENLRADPAQFVAQEPGVRAANAAMEAAPGDATALQSYVTATLAAQERMGLPEDERRVLSRGVSQTIASRLMRGDPANEAVTVGAQLQGLANQYGTQWPRVFGDLVRDGRLPDEYRVLAAIDGPVGQNDYQRMMTAARQLGGMDKMRNSVNPVERTAIMRDVDGYVEPFMRTAVAGQSTGGFQLASMVREAVTNMAHYYVMQGQSASTALQTATDRIINDKYEIVGTMRVPRALPDGTPLGIGPVSRAQAVVMRGLTPEAMPDPGGNPQLTPERRREIYAQSAQNGFWVPNQRDDGLVLMATRANGAVLPVMRADGTRVELQYSALPQAGGVEPVGSAGHIYQEQGTAGGIYARQPGQATGIYAPQRGRDIFAPPAGAPAAPTGGAGSPAVTPPVGPRPQPGMEPRRGNSGAAPRGPQRWRGENAR